MINDDILIEVFRFCTRKSLEKAVRLTCHRYSTLVLRYVPNEPYHIVRKLFIDFTDSTAYLSQIVSEKKRLIQPYECVEFNDEICKFRRGELWRKLLDKAPIPRYLRVIESEFECGNRFQVDPIKTIRKLKPTWTDDPRGRVTLHLFNLAKDRMMKIVDLVTVADIKILCCSSFYSFFSSPAIRQCEHLEFETHYRHEDESENSFLVDWLHDNSATHLKRVLDIAIIHCTQRVIDRLVQMLLDAFQRDDRKRDYELCFCYSSSRRVRAPIVHEKDGECLSIKEKEYALCIERKAKVVKQ